MIRFLPYFLFFLFSQSLFAQFPPGADQAGTTAIPKEDSRFINWAKTVVVERGEQNISDDSLNYAEIGEPEFAIGTPDNQIVSLGDGGIATLTFDPPITNGEGFDFAVFENGFPTFGGYFLELAFVEVSSDGVFFVRFPATSLTDTMTQLGTFDLIDPAQINNLAGKYEGGFGTPFDLEELAKIPEIDVNKITHVRIIDVIGSLADSLATSDSQGNKINDPFPTAFPSGGFDLDAIGVIHQKTSTRIDDFYLDNLITIYPNPIPENGSLLLKFEKSLTTSPQIQLFSQNGVLLKNISFDFINQQISLVGFSTGIYWLKISTDEHSTVKKIVVLD